MKILVVRFSSIGDIVLCTPVFRWIKSHYPDAEIHFLTKSKFSQVLKGNPHIDQIIQWEDKQQRSEMFGTNYQLILDLHNNLRTRWVKLRFWSVPTRSLLKSNLHKLFLVGSTKSRIIKRAIQWRWFRNLFFFVSGDGRSNFNEMSATIPSSQSSAQGMSMEGVSVPSIVERNLELLGSLGRNSNAQNRDWELDFYFRNPIQRIELPNKFVAFVLGGTYATKQMPLELLLKIMNQIDADIVLLGGPSEKVLSEQLTSQLLKPIMDFCGVLNLNDSAWVASQASVVVSGDTGMAHIAAGIGSNLIMIWGNTVPEFGMSPPVKTTANIHHFNVLGLDCRPCSKLGFSACPQGHFNCMMNQDSTRICATIEKYL